jgi:regulator of sirC expression with transglutaminase-like and TPR domain
MTGRGEAERTLRSLGAAADDAFDLAEGALALAALDTPAAPLAPYRAHLDHLAADVARATRDGGSAAGQVEALTTALHLAHRYTGDAETYDDLQNANLMRVIDRRKGLPVALGIIYIHAARKQGWRMSGLNFPGHFLIRLDHGGERAIVDPFHDGRRCGTAEMRELIKLGGGRGAELLPQYYAEVSDRDVLVRLHNNVKSRHLGAGRIEAALASVESMLMFAPTAAALWREAGLLNARVGKLGAAIAALEQCATRAADDDVRRDAERLIAEVRRRLN